MEDTGKLVVSYTASGKVLEEPFERAIWQYTLKKLHFCQGLYTIKIATELCSVYSSFKKKRNRVIFKQIIVSPYYNSM